jgi:hypothetical protein
MAKAKKKSIAVGAVVASVAAFAFVALCDGQSDTNEVAAASGRGATQKWVNMRIEQTKDEIMADVDLKISALSAQLNATIEANLAILADASNTNAIQEATANAQVAAQPLASAILETAWQ